jgi:hypothetical protein
MNEEVKIMWVDALLSGDFEKTSGMLARVHTLATQLPWRQWFCALGVLCELAYRNGVVQKYYDPQDNIVLYDGSWLSTPVSVCRWAGFDDDDGDNPMTSMGTIQHLNDELELSFEEIADIIKSEL